MIIEYIKTDKKICTPMSAYYVVKLNDSYTTIFLS
ncbi:hypothetical protein AB670_01509 [Chryseobacterium sp. MOF25P]|nr:hypothetical protein AB670_01509 [Chryseobacterium sp. MOF25P]OBW45454.1 hypothetical protein AB671_02414 [Chryseobacterium sp. BGARF1]